MSSPLVFVRDGRTLPYFPVTHNALAAIAIAVDCDEENPKRLAAARSLYLALLELANQERSARVPATRRKLGELAGISRDLVSDVRPVLERAQVVRVVEHFHGNQQTEHEWVICEPPEGAEDVPEYRHPVAESQGGGGALPHRTALEEELQEEDSLRSSSGSEVARDRLREANGVMVLCERLAEHIVRLDPKAKPRADSMRWLQAAERLMRLDGRPLEECIAVMDWAMTDPFWQDHIESMPYFRTKYKKLRAQRQKARPRSAAAAPASTAELAAAYERGRSRTGL